MDVSITDESRLVRNLMAGTEFFNGGQKYLKLQVGIVNITLSEFVRNFSNDMRCTVKPVNSRLFTGLSLGELFSLNHEPNEVYIKISKNAAMHIKACNIITVDIGVEVDLFNGELVCSR
jgi:hypothetical protein